MQKRCVVAQLCRRSAQLRFRVDSEQKELKAGSTLSQGLEGFSRISSLETSTRVTRERTKFFLCQRVAAAQERQAGDELRSGATRAHSE
ncbi:hypothetical protein AGIG_G8888 [Arapaima gigas]